MGDEHDTFEEEPLKDFRSGGIQADSGEERRYQSAARAHTLIVEPPNFPIHFPHWRKIQDSSSHHPERDMLEEQPRRQGGTARIDRYIHWETAHQRQGEEKDERVKVPRYFPVTKTGCG